MEETEVTQEAEAPQEITCSGGVALPPLGLLFGMKPQEVGTDG